MYNTKKRVPSCNTRKKNTRNKASFHCLFIYFEWVLGFQLTGNLTRNQLAHFPINVNKSYLSLASDSLCDLILIISELNLA